MKDHSKGSTFNREQETLGAIGERRAVASVLARLARGRSGSRPGHHPAGRDADESGRNPLIIGPGDDAAVFRLPEGEAAVLTTDTLVEGVHFDRRWSSPQDLGYKLIQSATSDVGAMGATPRAALVAVSAPGLLGASELVALTEGMLEAADEHSVVLAGGDTTGAPLLVLTATLLGGAPPASVRTRAGASPGDRLVVTGELGDAASGLRVLGELSAKESTPAETWLTPKSALVDLEARLAARGFAGQAHALAAAVRRFLRPSPPIAAGPIAARQATALIDISDGLASELALIAEASHVGMVVEATAVPLGAGARAWAAHEGGDPLALALDGGEDYELLIAVPPAAWDTLAASLAAIGVRATAIGDVVPYEQGLQLRTSSGQLLPLTAGGYEHFRRRNDS